MVCQCVDGCHHRKDGRQAKEIFYLFIQNSISSLTFIATPRTFGHDFRFALNLWYDRPAFKIGLSIRPPPATIPIFHKKYYFSTIKSNYYIYMFSVKASRYRFLIIHYVRNNRNIVHHLTYIYIHTYSMGTYRP